MSLTSLQELAFLLCAFYLLFRLARSIQSALASDLAGIPGPFLARFSSTWSLWHQLNGRKFLAVHESFARFGPVVRAGPKTVYVSDFRLLGAVYQSKLDKIPAYSGFTTNNGVANVFSTIEAHAAAGKRRGMLPHYATAALTEWQPCFDSHIEELCELALWLGPEQDVNVLSLLAHALIDILGEIVLDSRISSLSDYSQGKKNAIVQAITLWPKRGTIMGVLPRPIWKVLAQIPYAPWQQLVQSDARLADFVQPLVSAARQDLANGAAPQRQALSHRLSIAQDSHLGSLWSEEHVTSECIDHFLAGTETTSTTLTYALWQLSIHAEIMKTLQDEVDEASPNAELLTLQEAARLPYLNAVLKETMRLFTAGPGSFDRVVSSEGLMLGEYYLPPGTFVGLQSYTLHREVAVWGDPFVFRPERWLKETPEMRSSFIPFSVGGRACPGLNLAWVDMRLILSALLRRFSVSPASATTEESMAPVDYATISPVKGECRLHFHSRVQRA